MTISEHHPKPSEGQPLAEWEREVLEEQAELTKFLHVHLPAASRCGCEDHERCPWDWDESGKLAVALIGAGWRKPSEGQPLAEWERKILDDDAWPCANFSAPWTCLIPPDHTTVMTRCSFCVDQAAAAVALTPEELERLAGTALVREEQPVLSGDEQ